MIFYADCSNAGVQCIKCELHQLGGQLWAIASLCHRRYPLPLLAPPPLSLYARRYFINIKISAK